MLPSIVIIVLGSIVIRATFPQLEKSRAENKGKLGKTES